MHAPGKCAARQARPVLVPASSRGGFARFDRLDQKRCTDQDMDVPRLLPSGKGMAAGFQLSSSTVTPETPEESPSGLPIRTRILPPGHVSAAPAVDHNVGRQGLIACGPSTSRDPASSHDREIGWRRCALGVDARARTGEGRVQHMGMINLNAIPTPCSTDRFRRPLFASLIGGLHLPLRLPDEEAGYAVRVEADAVDVPRDQPVS